MHDDTQQQPLRVHRDVVSGFGLAEIAGLRPMTVLAASQPRGPPASVVFTLWLSIMAAVGLGSCPVASRSRTTRWWRMLSHTPALRNARK